MWQNESVLDYGKCLQFHRGFHCLNHGKVGRTYSRASLNLFNEKIMCYPDFIGESFVKGQSWPTDLHSETLTPRHQQNGSFQFSSYTSFPKLKQEHNHSRCFQDAIHISFCKWPSNTYTKYLNYIPSDSIFFFNYFFLHYTSTVALVGPRHYHPQNLEFENEPQVRKGH